MKNVTITLPDDVAKKARVEAAKAGLSVSAWFRHLAERAGLAADARTPSDPALEAAWDRLLNGPVFDLGFKGKLPSREERNARR
jgi:hypothetical protein